MKRGCGIVNMCVGSLGLAGKAYKGDEWEEGGFHDVFFYYLYFVR